MMNFTEDRFWGFVLIALGAIALVFRPFDKVNSMLQGSPDRTLTLMLFGLGLIAWIIAIKAKPAFKALAVFWIITP